MLATVVSVLLANAACGASTGGAEGCGPILREGLDPAYLVHVLTDTGDLEYRSDPPTSGPHQPAPSQRGVVDEPLTRPVQVGILERGDVLVQHLPDLAADEVSALRALAADRVVIAPNADLPEPVVATAWVFKRSCGAVDIPALEDFIEQRSGQGPEG